jgi:hypothetical protein
MAERSTLHVGLIRDNPVTLTVDAGETELVIRLSSADTRLGRDTVTVTVDVVKGQARTYQTNPDPTVPPFGDNG